MNRVRKILPLALLMLGACSAAPTHYYTLLRAQPQPLPVRAQGFVIDVQPVTIPAQLDQSAILVRQGPGEVALAEQRQWIAPLAQELRAGLVQRLQQRLGVAEISRLATPEGVTVYRVLLDVQRLDARLAQSVSLDAGWTVMTLGPADKTPKLRQTCASSQRVSVAAGYPALVEGIQQGLDQLAGQIATLIAQAQAQAQTQSGAALSCPSPAGA